MRSEAGIAEAYVISKGALDELVVGSALPSGAYKLAGAIAANRELNTEPYNPPKDMYGNIIRQNSKKNYKIMIDTIQSDLATVNIADYIHRINGGADILVIPEGYEKYEGNASGVPQAGTGIYWIRNPYGGIYFFDQINDTYMGIDYEFKLDDSQQQLNIIAEVALSQLKHRQLQLASETNIVKDSAVALPDINKDKQYVLDLVALDYHDGTTWQGLINYEDIDSISLSLKTISNKQKKTNRSIKSLGEINFTVISADGTPSAVRGLDSIDQFARIRASFANPVDGLIYYLDVYKNQITNNTNLRIAKDERKNTFVLAGQFSISKMKWALGTTRTIQIGY